MPIITPHSISVPKVCCILDRFRKPLLVIYGLILLLCLPVLWALHVSDSPQALNALPKDLQAEDQLIRDIMGLRTATPT